MLSPGLREQLQNSIGDRYSVERELGGGGMSHVFVAREAALNREVVIKVLAPDLAGGVSLDRFRREIELAARLQHPSIVPLLNAGEAAGLPYYTMPFVQGESLRARIARGGELPVRDAVAILRDVARALAYAHAQGVVHRDIKPDNVLLSGDYATVTDFGVAKAIVAARSRGDEQSSTLTALGVALGTPAYMSPEQSAGDPATDHRTDVYAFGVMAYEMLAGEPPFTARSPQAMIAAHATQGATPLALKRPALPPSLAALVMRCMEKRPADRPQSADEIVRELEAVATPSATMAAPARFDRRRVWSIGAAVVAVAVVAAGFIAMRRIVKDAPMNPNVIAVVPFRVTSADPGIKSLREGVLDLIAAKLTSGVRVADTRTTLAAWRGAGGSESIDLDEEKSIHALRGIGAGRLLQGEIADAAGLMTIHATLVDMSRRAPRVEASVSGGPQAIASLLDSLIAKLLAKDVGANDQSASQLARFPFPALQAYVEGQRYLRAGLYDKATEAFARAVDIDSTFALAGLQLASSAGWSLDRRGPMGSRIARAHQDQLGPTDRLLLEDLAPEGVWSCASQLVDEEKATQIAPESPDVWYRLADNLFHCGAEMGIDDAFPRALAGFNRAIALDSSFAQAREHVPTLYAIVGDTVMAAKALRLLVADTSDYYALNQLFIRHDAKSQLAALQSLKKRPIAQMAAFGLGYVSMVDPPRPDFGDSLLETASRRAVTDVDRTAVAEMQLHLLLAEGRPTRADAVAKQLGRPDLAMLAALLSDGDSAMMRTALPALDAALTEPPPASFAEVTRWSQRIYARAEYELNAGRVTPTFTAALQKLSQYSSSDAVVESRVRRLAIVLDAQAAVLTKRPDARRLVEIADSTLRLGMPNAVNASSGNLIVARLWERLGDLPRAYAATKRVYKGTRSLLYPATYARERGRLAAATGNNDDALLSYQRYVAMRASPEPSIAPDVDAAKKEIARLQKLTGGR